MVYPTSSSTLSRPAAGDIHAAGPAPLAVSAPPHDLAAGAPSAPRACRIPGGESWTGPGTPSVRSDRHASLSSSPTSSLPAGSPPAGGGATPWATATGAAPPASPLPSPSAAPRGPDGLSDAEHLAIGGAFAAAVPELFGHDLVYAFICGSVARQHAIRADDIDTFVVLHEKHPATMKAYTAWLTNLHAAFGLVIDPTYPHEVVTRHELDEVVWPRLASTHLDLDFNTTRTFDTVTWADMVAGPRAAAVYGQGGERALASDAATAAPHVARWHADLLARLAASPQGVTPSEATRGAPTAGHLASCARAYLDGPAFARDFPGDRGATEAFDWRRLAPLALSRLVRRVAPLPTEPLDATVPPIAEALMAQPTLSTWRLVLRPLDESDAPAIFEMCRRPEVAEHCSWEPMTSLNQAAAYIARQQEAARAGEATNWAMWHRGRAQLIGTIGLVDLDVDDGRATLGFALHPDFWRLGLCTEAGRRLVDFLERQGITKISADVVRGHYASQKVLLNLRMDPEGISRRHVKKHGSFHDLITYTRLSGGR